MNLAALVFAFIRRRPLTWGFHVLTLATGVAIVLALLLLGQAVNDRFARDLAHIDLVVGAKGSPLQIVLSAVFEMDTPTGNIPLAEAQRISRNGLVAFAVPVSIGDNLDGMRIVGTTPAYGRLYHAALAGGRWWSAPQEAVLGATTARRLHLRLGDTFVGAHGLGAGGERHAASPYRVVGVLKPTGAVIDRLVLTDLASIWAAHRHEDDADAVDAQHPPQLEVTALLVRYRSAMGALMLPQMVKATPDLQAASPAIETARLFSLLGVGAAALRAVGLAILGLATLGFFVALFAAVTQRRRDLALIRALGGSPALLLAIVALEGALLGLAAGAAGVGLARLLIAALAQASQSDPGGPFLVAPGWGARELTAAAAALCLAVIASIGPAVVAARTQPARELMAG